MSRYRITIDVELYPPVPDNDDLAVLDRLAQLAADQIERYGQGIIDHAHHSATVQLVQRPDGEWREPLP